LGTVTCSIALQPNIGRQPDPRDRITDHNDLNHRFEESAERADLGQEEALSSKPSTSIEEKPDRVGQIHPDDRVGHRGGAGKATGLVLNPGPWQITGQRIN
jgi:hypothetical protein